MKYMNLLLALSVGVFMATFIGACSDPSNTADPCRPDQVGLLSCSDNNDLLLVCSEAETWDPQEDCAADDKTCVQPLDATPSCMCESGAVRCSPDGVSIESCNDEGDWVQQKACDEGTECKVEGDAPVCVSATCTEGETRCSEDESQVEACDANNNWAATVTCDQGQLCQIEGDVAKCGAASDLCTPGVDVQRCDPADDSIIQECLNGMWQLYRDCSDDLPGYVCEQIGTEFPFCNLGPPT